MPNATRLVVLRATIIFFIAQAYSCGEDTVIPLDHALPAAVIDLAIRNPTTNSVTLSWTAPGDDVSSGTAAQYDIRYATSPITDENWPDASQAMNEPSPQPAGSAETFVVADLSPDTDYYFALMTADEASNWSALSNVVLGRT
jgi:hypothetical protein